MMNITLNNQPANFDGDSMTIRELLDNKRFTFKMLVVKLNGRLIRKEDYEQVQVHDGDQLDVIHLMSGG